MSPGQESVDEYLSANYPPCKAELGAYRADLHAKVEALPGALAAAPPDRMVLLSDVIALIDGGSDE